MEDKKPVETGEMAVRSSGGVAEDLNNSLIEGSSVRSSSFVDNTIQSDIARDSGSGDEKPLSSVLGPENSLPYGDQNVSSKEESYSGSEIQDMEIDMLDDTDKNQIGHVRGEGDRVLQNAENRSNLLNDAVDLNQCTSTDEDVSLDVNAKPVEPEFYVSDLVWGKVRSHPWWPGQIFDRSAATAKAKKYFKRDCYLIAYYGDQTFSWNEASQIKPFRPHFSHMEKQNFMDEFHYAVGCALDEVSRQVEFGLACSCISEEAYAQVKTQVIVNAGIREESSRRDGGDRYSSAVSFDPFELVETMKALAQSPSYCEVDRLQFITSRAQLLAFHRWKGYSKLPEFQNLCGLLETDTEIPLSKEVKKCSKLIGNDVPSVKVDKQVLSNKEKPKRHGGSSHKEKKIPTVSSKKEKSLSELIAERRLSLQNGKRKLNNKAGDRLISSSPAKKLKAVDSACDDSAVKQKKNNVSTGSIDKSLPSKRTFRVGASILRVASQLNGSIVSTPVLKHGNGTSQRSAVNKLRNSIAMDLNISETCEQSLEQGIDVIMGEKSARFKITGKSELTSIKDSCCSDSIIQYLPEEQLAVDKHNQITEVSPNTTSGKGFSIVELLFKQVRIWILNRKTVTDENLGMEAEKRIAYSDKSCTEDLSTTALILNFSDRFDAEIAFSSSGKYSILGPSLVGHRLSRLVSTPAKASPGATKRSRMDETCGDEDATRCLILVKLM
ncbi:hypothetical protein CRYUN_Cryun05aG0243100 [Craigia yunnanensis]